MSFILYFFFNVNLIKQRVRLKLKINVIKFVNDVNILTYKKNTENNCKTLDKLHDVYKKQVKQHKIIIVLTKYEFIHLMRRVRIIRHKIYHEVYCILIEDSKI